MKPPEIEQPHTNNSDVAKPSLIRKQTTTSTRLVEENEIAVYIQQTFQYEDLIYFLTNTEPARFNFPKPPNLPLSDDTWAALKLRVDHLARNILDPQRYYAMAICVSILTIIVFYAIRPDYNRKKRIHQQINEEERPEGVDDDEWYDDYIADDEYEKYHSVDDVVLAELEYLNTQLDHSLWIWRIGLAISLIILFGSVIFIAVLMERKNSTLDDHIQRAVEEIKPRVENEGLTVEYRTKSSHHPTVGMLLFFGKYIRPTRVVVFSYLDSPSPKTRHPTPKSTGSFFSEDYQRRYFPPNQVRSIDEFSSSVAGTSSFGIL